MFRRTVILFQWLLTVSFFNQIEGNTKVLFFEGKDIEKAIPLLVTFTPGTGMSLKIRDSPRRRDLA